MVIFFHRFVTGYEERKLRRRASGHEKIPVCGQLAPGARPSEFLVRGHEVSR
jgi:hypothetical protein